MQTFLQDLRYGARMLWKSPSFTLIAVLTLALGIGANTAIFTIINAVLLRMLPVSDVERLVVIGDPTAAHTRSHGTPRTDLYSYPLYRELRDRNNVFSGVLAGGIVPRMRANKGSGESVSDNVLGVLVSGNYFSVLGVNPYAGRTLTENDDKTPAGHPVAVISYSMFRDRFNSDSSVIGSTVRLNDYPFTIIGVAPPGFHGQVVGDVQEVWIPLMMQAEVMRGRKWLEDPNSSWLTLMARLRPGVSIDQAKANVNLVFKQALAGAYGAKVDPQDRKSIEHNVIDVVGGSRGLSTLRGAFAKPLMLLMGMVGLVLLIACVNVANLLLARAAVRQKEIAVRLAIGAKPTRVVRQLLTESVLLALIGGACGLLFAFWGARILLTLVSGLPLESTGLNVSPDANTLAFTVTVSLLTGILFGLVPAFRALKVELNGTLKSTTSSVAAASSKGFGWGKLLVVSQVALSVLVLFTAGLLVRSLRNLQNVDLGYSRDQLIIAQVDPVEGGYDSKDAIAKLSTDLRDRFAGLPGVKQVTASELGLFSGSEGDTTIHTDATRNLSDEDRVAEVDYVAPDYFSTLAIPVLLGREIGRQDTSTSTPIVVINEALVKRFFPGVNPIGRKLFTDDSPKPMEVVGVVVDTRNHDVDKAPLPRFYVPISQTERLLDRLHLELRVQTDAATLTEPLRAQIKSYNPALPIRSIKTLNSLVTSSIRNEIAVAKLSSIFGALALLLACIGIYGVMSYTVAGRTKELGVRIALGASGRQILHMVFRDALVLVFAGVVVGIPVAIACTRAIKSMLYGVSNTDATSIALTIAILVVIAVMAAFAPALRAMKIDPMVALREE